MNTGLGYLPLQKQLDKGNSRQTCGAGHRTPALIVGASVVDHPAVGFTIGGPRLDPKVGELGFIGLQSPLVGQQLQGQFARRDCGVSDFYSRRRDKAGITEPLQGPTDGVNAKIARRLRRGLRARSYRRVRREHAWLPITDARDVIAAANTVLDRYPQGEAPIAIGNVLHAWNRGECDGVVVASPWGCGPALIAESLLRHRRDIPMMFVYADGSPIDQRKLNAFAFRLRRT